MKKNILMVLAVFLGALVAGATDFSLNPARDFGAIRRINPVDYDGKAIVREDGTGISSDTAQSFRRALDVPSTGEIAVPPELAAHIASTGTAVHGLGSMSTASTTDYVATGTFTGHTGDSSDPHGATLTQTNASFTRSTVASFSTIGDTCVPLKLKVISGTTAAAEGGTASASHGLDSTKIINFYVVVQYGVGAWVGQNHTINSELQYDAFIDANRVYVQNSTSNSGSVLSDPFKAFIWYGE